MPRFHCVPGFHFRFVVHVSHWLWSCRGAQITVSELTSMAFELVLFLAFALLASQFTHMSVSFISSDVECMGSSTPKPA